MVERQLRRRGIDDARVLAAMNEVPRELFVPPDQRRRAYRDGALRIAEGQTISQPWIVACMAQLLELRGDETVLEVGTGSGYAAAVLSRLCPQVITIERYAGLAESAAATLAELGYSNVEVSAPPRERSRRARCSTSSRRAARSSARSRAGAAST
jgi:protein-L-isoaspartate(D-aspartate) O-methyltransferase